MFTKYEDILMLLHKKKKEFFHCICGMISTVHVEANDNKTNLYI